MNVSNNIQTVNKSYKSNSISQNNQSGNEYLNDQPRIHQISREPSPAIQNRIRASNSKTRIFQNTTPIYSNHQGQKDNISIIRNSGSNIKASIRDSNQPRSRINSRYNSRNRSPGSNNNIKDKENYYSHSKSPNLQSKMGNYDTRSASKIIIADAGRSQE